MSGMSTALRKTHQSTDIEALPRTSVDRAYATVEQ